MIEILREGTKRQIECKDCGALLRFQQEDIKTAEHWISSRDSRTYKYITCPQCHAEIILEAQR